MNRIVLDVVPVLALESVREFPLAFKPSMVTLSAPLRSIKGPAMEPEIVRPAPPAGEIVIFPTPAV